MNNQQVFNKFQEKVEKCIIIIILVLNVCSLKSVLFYILENSGSFVAIDTVEAREIALPCLLSQFQASHI